MAPPDSMESAVERAIAAFSAGEPVMVFDSDFRERETDLLWPADAATPQVMRTLRNDCGGLLFLAIGNEIGDMFGLPWLQDIHTHPALVDENPVLVSRFVPEMMFPCFVVLNGGELVDRKYGVPATVEPRPFFEAWFESVVR